MMVCMLFTCYACITSQNNNEMTNQMNYKSNLVLPELKIEGVTIQHFASGDGNNNVYVMLTAPCHKELLNKEIYYQSFSGKLEKDQVTEDLCKAKLKKNSAIIPRSIYPFLSEGYIVVKCTWLGFDKFKIIKKYEVIE